MKLTPDNSSGEKSLTLKKLKRLLISFNLFKFNSLDKKSSILLYKSFVYGT